MLLIFMGIILISVLMPFFVSLYVQNHPEKFYTHWTIFEYVWVEEENLLHLSERYIKKKLPQKYIDKWYDPTLRSGTIFNLLIGVSLGVALWLTYEWGLFFLFIPWVLGNLIWVFRISTGEEMHGTDREMREIFSAEIDDFEAKNREQQRICEEWRSKHPLEEQCRKALTGNPNYVADLLRMLNLISTPAESKIEVENIEV